MTLLGSCQAGNRGIKTQSQLHQNNTERFGLDLLGAATLQGTFGLGKGIWISETFNDFAPVSIEDGLFTRR
jgi:hypothetical protein